MCEELGYFCLTDEVGKSYRFDNNIALIGQCMSFVRAVLYGDGVVQREVEVKGRKKMQVTALGNEL